MSSLNDKVALVTGAGRGIGRETAIALAMEGVRVAAAARSFAEIEAVAGETGGIAVRCDVSSLESIEAAIREIEKNLGPIDILINNAGAAGSNLIERTTDEQWDLMIKTNVYGPFRLVRAVLPAMKERGWGRIVSVASRAGKRGQKYLSAYCASKHALVGLTRALAAELDGTGVTANAVCPAAVDTQMTRESVDNVVRKTGMSEKEAYAKIASMNRSGRLIAPREVAAEIVKLCIGNANGALVDME